MDLFTLIMLIFCGVMALALVVLIILNILKKKGVIKIGRSSKKRD